VREIGVGVFGDCEALFSNPSGGISSFLSNDDFWKEGETPLRLDGWYNETYRVLLNGKFTSLRFTFRDKYDERGINECVYIEANSRRIYPRHQTGERFIIDLRGVNELLIRSIRPGKEGVPYSREITLDNVIFHY
jgi:hypothetical protein